MTSSRKHTDWRNSLLFAGLHDRELYLDSKQRRLMHAEDQGRFGLIWPGRYGFMVHVSPSRRTAEPLPGRAMPVHSDS
jgi:hypothetical protein